MHPGISASSQTPFALTSASQSPHRRQGRRAGCRRSRSRLRGCQHIRTRRWRQAVADAALVVGTHAVVDVVTNAIGIFVGHAVTAADTEGVKLVAVTVAIAFWDVSASALVDGARSVADAALVEFTNKGSTLSLPSASSSAAQSPPQTPRASSWLPQSQSPSGMSAHPHS